MFKTKIVLLGQNRMRIADTLSVLLNDQYKLQASIHACNKDEILDILMEYDLDKECDDIIFICCDQESSSSFVKYKYDEKVILKLDRDPRRWAHGPSVCWVSEAELPSLIIRLERNISEHANF